MDRDIANLRALLRAMEPLLHPGVYAYCEAPPGTDISVLSPVVTVRETEGLTLVLPEEQALQAGLPVRLRAAWITLTVHSDLQAVGFTAAFSGALAKAGISCNVVAGVHHDHIFLPVDQAQRALAALKVLQHNDSEVLANSLFRLRE